MNKLSTPVALLTAAALGAAACLGDEKYHIEQRQFESEPQLTRAGWISTRSGTEASLIFYGDAYVSQT